MKILMINVVCGIRSTGRICTDLAKELEAQGHEVKIAYGRETVPEQYQKYAVRIGTDLGIKINALKARIFDNEGLNAIYATKKFLKWAAEYNPDMVWLHNIHGYYINYELLFKWIKARPQMQVKWTLHDCWSFTGHCAYFTMAKCEQWKTECKNCPQKRSYPASNLLSRAIENQKKKKSAFSGVPNMRLITPSQWLADLTRESYLSEYPVEVRHNEIDRTIFKPVQSDFKEKHGITRKMVLGVAAVWDARKGLEDFLRLAELRKDLTIVLVGLSEEQQKTLPNNVIAVRKTNSPYELAEIYSAAEVFFNPTYEDNYPTVNLEAEACGTSVITYDVGGAAETIHRDDSYAIIVGDTNTVLRLIDQ